MRLDTVTIKDIAKVLNFSSSTVSRALRGSYEISEKTKEIVLAYAEKVNYRPNPIALSLKERRSRTIGVVVSEIANNFFSQAINGIESIAYNCGYHVIIAQSHELEKREKVNVMLHASRSIDGLLISLSSGTVDISYLKDLHEKGLPIVFFDRITDEIDTHTVTANNRLGAFRVTEHLICQGFKKIAHLTSSPYLSITNERLQGYREALKKHNIPFDEKLVRYCNHGGMIAEEIEEAVTSLFKNKPKPDAIFTTGDRITTVCIKILKNAHSRREVGFAGFTNIKVGELFDPPITVVRQPAFQMGQAAIEMLIQLIESKRPVLKFETRMFDTELIIRESSLKKKK